VIELLKGQPPALVVTNVALPGMSGHEAIVEV
jgi:hypothetical protein